jgi:hypothetical protein
VLRSLTHWNPAQQESIQYPDGYDDNGKIGQHLIVEIPELMDRRVVNAVPHYKE